MLADQLMAEGDLRGELLALELAAASAADAAESRRLTREVQHWRRLDPTLAWSPVLMDHYITLRGGLPINADHRLFTTEVPPPLLHRVRTIEARVPFDVIPSFLARVAASPARIESLDLHQLESKERSLDLLPIAGLRSLSELRVKNGLNRGSECLAELEKLERLQLTTHESPPNELLTNLAGLPLRELSIASTAEGPVDALSRFGATLERLELLGMTSDLSTLPAPRLVELSLMRDAPGEGLSPLPSAVERLDLFYLDDDELDALRGSGATALTLWDAEYLDDRALEAPASLRELIVQAELSSLTLASAPGLHRLEIHDFIETRVILPASIEALGLHARVTLGPAPNLRLKALDCDDVGAMQLAGANLDQLETLRLDLASHPGANHHCVGLIRRCPSLRRARVHVGNLLPKLDGELGELIAELAKLPNLRECAFIGHVPLAWLAKLDEPLPGVACLAGPGSTLEAMSWPRFGSS